MTPVSRDTKWSAESVKTIGSKNGTFSAISIACIVVFAVPTFAQEPEFKAQTTVGMSGKLEQIVLPGTELETKPIDDRKSPIILRIVRVFPHGSDFRYDLEFYGLDPGTYDLRDSLKRKDGTPTTGLPPLKVKVSAILPPGQIEPHKQTIDPGPRVGGYRQLITFAIAIWILGLLIVIAWLLRPLIMRKALGVSMRPPTMADQLQPLVEGAVAGKLSQVELAGLERALLAFWRKRLGLEKVEPSLAIDTLRADPNAGPLLMELENWLHKPGPAREVDVARLLAPYRNLPANAAELPRGPGGVS